LLSSSAALGGQPVSLASVPIRPPTSPAVPTGLLTSAEGKDASLSRKMSGLKRKKRKFTRTLEGLSSSNQKVCDFDFATYPSKHHLTTVNAQKNLPRLLLPRQGAP
jgi:hypothetical protein